MFGDLYNMGRKWDSYAFVDAIEDISRKGTKIPKEEYLEFGEYPIIDQGQDFIAGYTDKNEGMIPESETIVFGDHTRCFKCVDFPYFMGEDCVKVLKVKIEDLDYRFYLRICKF
jgi:restriction endonuclease S subunit (fragment)